MKVILLGLSILVHVFGTIGHSLEATLEACKPSGHIQAKGPQPGLCSQLNTTDCCVPGRFYPVYNCSPPVSANTAAMLTLNSFEKGGDGASPSECDSKYHSDDTPVVALSTGWYSGGGRCHHNISISGNGRRVNGLVVDECDSSMGCDEEHHHQPPCSNNIVVASKAVWKALGVPLNEWGMLEITWSDA